MATSGSWDISWESGYWSSQANTKYYHWSGNWSKSGNTITLSNMKLWLTYTQSSSGSGTDSVTTTGGSAQSVTLTASGYASNQASLNSSSFSVGSTATSATIACYISDENTGSTTIYFDATYVAPTTPTVSVATTSATSSDLTITYGTTSFGRPTTGTVYLYGGSSASPTTQLATATSTGSQTFTNTGLDYNTIYYYRARAYNGQLYSSYSTDTSMVTMPPKPTLTLASQTPNSVTLNWSVPADGGALTKTIEYKLSTESTWTTVDTVTTGDATSGTFTVSGLTPGSKVTIGLRSSTTTGFRADSVTVKLVYPFYGSVNGETKAISKFYGSVGGVTKQITKLYGSVNGVTKRIF